MVTISLCMIVKNEEKVLKRCLDSYKPIADEIIIVDTGSTDRTKEIALEYTDKVYDFPWIKDFAAARNEAFSKATMEYIFSADADEVLDEKNLFRFKALKKCLTPDVEIVQMKYGNQLSFGTVYNFDEEYRPKLFKRQREFVWIDPIHESVRLEPVVFDSDIVITHKPHDTHAKRDFDTFLHHIYAGHHISKHMLEMYVRELFMAGDAEDFANAFPFFEEKSRDVEISTEHLHQCLTVLARACRLAGDSLKMFKYAMKANALGECSEVCVELGHYYKEVGDMEEAIIWYYNAGFETEPIIRLESNTKDPLEGLSACYRALGMEEQAAEYEAMLAAPKGEL